jgi:hypothetical protein
MKQNTLLQMTLYFVLFVHLAGAIEKNQEITMASIPPNSIVDLDLLYNSEFTYSLPRNFLESYLSGKAFDNNEAYTEDESDRLRDDINKIYQTILSTHPVKEGLAIVTAGAPGAGKTVKIREELAAYAAQGKYFAYVCPDDVCLQGQSKTYKSDLDKSGNTPDACLKAYNKWRPGSNAATHLILGNLVREKYAFYFGTTASGPATNKFFEFLKGQGYRIRLIHVSAPDEVRWESIKERDKTFVQTTEQDVRDKGMLLPQRINDTFLEYADEIDFYYRDNVSHDAVLAAKWSRNHEGQKFSATLQLVNPEAYGKVKAIHEQAIKTLERPDLSWEASVETNCEMIVNPK